MQGAPTAQRQNLDALGAVRCRFQSAKLAGRALAGFAVASLREDRFGVLQLAEPNLGDVVLGILSALLAAKHLARQGVGSSAGAALGPWRATGDVAFGGGESDAAVHAVIDELGTDVRSVAEAFGAVLEEAVGKSTTTPSFATKAEAMAALHARLRPGKLS